MQTSQDRILTTHTGSLPRPPELRALLVKKDQGEAYDQAELERLTRRYTAGIIEMIGPERDIPAPDVNTNEQVMAWIMDTYAMHVGHATTAVVTGKPVEMGGSLGRRDSLTPRGRISPGSASC